MSYLPLPSWMHSRSASTNRAILATQRQKVPPSAWSRRLGVAWFSGRATLSPFRCDSCHLFDIRKKIISNSVSLITFVNCFCLFHTLHLLDYMRRSSHDVLCDASCYILLETERRSLQIPRLELKCDQLHTFVSSIHACCLKGRQLNCFPSLFRTSRGKYE
jgi:hypothetical protein